MTQIEFPKYQALVKNLPIGKQLPDAVYIHKSAFHHLPEALATLTLQMAKLFEITDNQGKLFYIHPAGRTSSMLSRSKELASD